ncbi:MAG TPA: sensor histidine kinase [Verrucomicrobiaceae bacterium]
MAFRKTAFAVLFAALAQAVFLRAADDSRVLTRAADVARFPSIDPDDQPRVRLEAVATFVDPTGTVFLHDDSGASFIRASERGKTMRPGQQILVVGRRYPGLFIGGIVPESITVLGQSALPEPLKVTPDDLASASHHYELVEMEGVGRTLEVTGESTATLRLNVKEKIIEVRFDQAPEKKDELIDAELRVRGLAAGAINDRRQLVMPYIRLADGRGLTIVKPAPADPFAIPVLPVSALLDAATTKPSPHRVKVCGVALGALNGGGLYLRESGRSVFVQTNETSQVQAGDDVEAVGFLQMGVFSAMLADARFRVSGRGDPPEARKADEKMLGSGACDAELVQFDARIIQKLPAENALLAVTGKHHVKILGGESMAASFEPGAEVRVTGLCRVTVVKQEGYRANPTDYEILLRDPRDAVLLSAAPWWNVRRMGIGLALVAGIALLAFAWIALLRRQVAKQLALLQAQAQSAATREERQRIAREFHDTLEQELAGLSLRLDAAATRVSDEKARDLLEQQRRLLSRLQRETHDFVWDLRDPSRQEAPLGEALQSLLSHLQAGTAIPFRIHGGHSSPPLPPLTQHHLLRIVREAVNNAAKYSNAKLIEVAMDGDARLLRLSIADDGGGFDLTTADAAAGHFGIRGMRERAGKIAADLNIASVPGKGTRVELTVPLSEPKA